MDRIAMTLHPVAAAAGLAVTLTLLMATASDARRRMTRHPPPPSAPVRPDQPPDDMSEPARSTYQVLHAFGKA